MNNRFAPRSKALPTTLCQKCLKRGHFSYECKATTQERPYKSRPSRTQQLLNPALRPTLAADEPANPLLQTKGIADALLAKAEETRGRRRDRSNDGSSSRSVSEHSSDSVSTISTNASRSLSRSRSPVPRRDSTSYADGHSDALRRRRISSPSPARSRSPRRTHLRQRTDRDLKDQPTVGRARSREHTQNRLRQASPNVPQRDQGNMPRRHRPRQRSPSPYSKRLALTEALNH